MNLPADSSPESVIQMALDEVIQVHQDLSASTISSVVDVAELLIDSFKRGGTLYLFGNGGSAAEAQHVATEFIVRFKRKRDPLPAVALTADTAVITAAGNDFEFDTIFSRQIRALVRSTDVIIALSTSGASANVLDAVRVGKELGATTVGFTGYREGELDSVADLVVRVPSKDTQRIQEAHLVLWHILCDLVDMAFESA